MYDDDINFDKAFNSAFKTATRIQRFAFAYFIGWLLFVLSFLGLAGWVIYHFVSKYW